MTGDLFPETKLRPEDDPNSRFTMPEMMAWIKAMCVKELRLPLPVDFAFDLDPFAHPESHWGDTWWTKADNAYTRTAFGKTFVNGPWDECEQVTQWISEQFTRNFRIDFVAQVLPGNRQEQPWWQELIEPIRDRRERDLIVTTHYPPGRTRYGFPGCVSGFSRDMNVNSVLLIWRTP